MSLRYVIWNVFTVRTRFFKESEYSDNRSLSLELHNKLIDEVATDGRDHCQYLRYTGQGETLLNKNLTNMVRYASLHSNVPINVTTNGVSLTAKRSKELLDAGVDVVDISIDAVKPETYAMVRKKGNLIVTKNNVLKLLDLIQTHQFDTKVVVSFVEQPLNVGEADEFEQFWTDAGCDFVVIRRRHSCAGSMEELASNMRASNGVRYPCLYPWERLVLSPNGKVGYCPADWKYQSKIADFKDTTIKEIWQGRFMSDLRAAHLKNDFSCHEFCGNCPDWESTRWPFQGNSYSTLMQKLVPPDLLIT